MNKNAAQWVEVKPISKSPITILRLKKSQIVLKAFKVKVRVFDRHRDIKCIMYFYTK